MSFIELHINSQPLLLNVNLIEAIKPSLFEGETQIFMAGSDADTFWQVTEPYEKVIEKIYEI